ncbi:hypothetical protein B0H19DRAFT_1386198 [Mycena capillaripes]|nr:hypothetical protein B0H19DRAFT_1386198 [Mycena capillaripes]
MADRELKVCSAEDSTVTLSPGPPLPREKSLGSPSPPPNSHTLLSFLPAWVSGPLQSPHKWKVLPRCLVATLVSFIILLLNASLRTIGGLFRASDKPVATPISPLQLTIFLFSNLVADLLSGWCIRIDAMRAANALRNQALIQVTGQQLQASIKVRPVFQANPALAQTTAVFFGWFLDVRSTAMHGAFLVIETFIFGAMRPYAPKLIFMSTFGTIALDVFCAVGPLFSPKWYNLLNSMAISVVLHGHRHRHYDPHFTETLSHAALDTVADWHRNAVREALHGVRPEAVLSILNAATTELHVASAAALSAVRATVELVNKHADDAHAASSQPRAALTAFEATGQSALLAPFRLVLQAAGTGPDAEADPPLRALFVPYVFAADVLGIPGGVLAFVDVLSGLDKARTRSRLWPTGLRSLWGLLVACGDKTDGAF